MERVERLLADGRFQTRPLEGARAFPPPPPLRTPGGIRGGQGGELQQGQVGGGALVLGAAPAVFGAPDGRRRGGQLGAVAAVPRVAGFVLASVAGHHERPPRYSAPTTHSSSTTSTASRKQSPYRKFSRAEEAGGCVWEGPVTMTTGEERGGGGVTSTNQVSRE